MAVLSGNQPRALCVDLMPQGHCASVGHMRPHLESFRTQSRRGERPGSPRALGDEACGQQWQRLGYLKRRIQSGFQKYRLYRFHLFAFITPQSGGLFQDFVEVVCPITA